MRYGWGKKWKLWQPYNRPLSEDELPYLTRMDKTTPGWRDPIYRQPKAEAVEEEES